MMTKKTKGFNKSFMDLSIKPGDDFAEYATGNLKKKYILRDDQVFNGPLIEVFEANEKKIQNIIIEFANTPQPKGSTGEKIGIFYNQILDTKTRNKLGNKPVKKDLKLVNSIKTIKEYQKIAAKFKLQGATALMFDFGVIPDNHNPNLNIVTVSQGLFVLPTKDLYTNTDKHSEKIRKAYKKYIKDLFTLADYSPKIAEEKMNSAYEIEKRIALSSYSKEKLRIADENYHKISYKELLKQFSGIDWNLIFKELGFPKFEYVNVKQPEPIHEVEKILSDTPLENLKNYFEFRLLNQATMALSEKFSKAYFRFFKTVSGMKEDTPLWKEATRLVNENFPDAIGQAYCKKYFPESSKIKIQKLAKNLQKALGERIKSNPWMSEKTKKEALKKQKNFSIKIGYPDVWEDYSNMQIKESLTLYENLKNANRFLISQCIKENVNKPCNKEKWARPPQTVNAYYARSENCVCFPAGILQYPFFDPDADDAINYGCIGTVIGHEMSHGFDDNGRLFDYTGVRKDWWTEDDCKAFKEKAKLLEKHFSKIEVINGKKINGKLTLGENIGDNGGITLALQAFHNTKNTKIIDGLTPDQRFFLAYSIFWTCNCRPEYIEACLTDVHPPLKYRCNGSLPHFDEWYEAFGIKKGDKLYIPKSKRAKIW